MSPGQASARSMPRKVWKFKTAAAQHPLLAATGNDSRVGQRYKFLPGASSEPPEAAGLESPGIPKGT